MARVSQEHLDARRRQILDGAARCFARNGFHATSMQDVLKEAGLSAGAVYRYFRSKEELIRAIAEDVFGTVRAAFESAARETPPPLPDVVLGRVLGQVFLGPQAMADLDREGFPRLVLQVWAETLRDEELAATLRRGYEVVRDAWTTLVQQYQRSGLMRDDVPADHVARTLVAAVQGFIAQQALFGESGIEVLEDGLRGLMSVPGGNIG
ncbi:MULTISPECIES: TetR/AcrR family transcriptional regulator [Streptomyces]|uniref:TetR/AcrR family transcriptional regulator n=1 Tax=Streptomyces lycii TaxID=2654337 RepID=A0ABQ7FPC6_9ACTN|nr:MULTISPECIES: TetR/AcrR family transcriptional regulator [Streptomyces]KAF4410478.1 TetR/AcrR family transcriptional regulator [Streptomyces lycii]PGH51766.1 TetR family transcriptional regulator [Streptomyces sp. Ru87]